MTPETDIIPPDVRISGGGGDITTAQGHETTRESSSNNGGRGQGWCGYWVCSGHQGSGGRGRRFNRPAYTSSIWDFKGEVDYFGALLDTTVNQIEAKDQYKKFSENLKQYVIQELQNPEDIIALVWDLKEQMTTMDP